jgi:hypothetical protein
VLIKTHVSYLHVNKIDVNELKVVYKYRRFIRCTQISSIFMFVLTYLMFVVLTYKQSFIVTPHVSKLHDYVNHMFMRPVDQIRSLESNSKFSNSGLVWTMGLGY